MPIARLTRFCGRRLLAAALAMAAVALVIGGLTLLSLVIAPDQWAPRKAPTNPFGFPLRDAAPSPEGLGAAIIALQTQFYVALSAALLDVQRQGASLFSLALVGFAYGIFHAAGPGHGKGVIGCYVLAHRSPASVAILMSTSAALLQAIVAIAVVACFSAFLANSNFTIGGAIRLAEVASFSAIAFLGAVLTFQKAGDLAFSLEHLRSGAPTPHVNVADAGAAPRNPAWPWVILAAGARPCSGALLLLALAASQGMFLSGAAGALAMALGTAITTSSIAVSASFVRYGVERLGKTDKPAFRATVGSFELVAASFIMVFGVVMAAGVSVSGLGSMID